MKNQKKIIIIQNILMIQKQKKVKIATIKVIKIYQQKKMERKMIIIQKKVTLQIMKIILKKKINKIYQ